ncbi:MAG TPA: hypothetical protein VM165_04635 [Planctomycetaceae bacterium]|nr:hypothetical protein [Planctomycetaceae bacterium]
MDQDKLEGAVRAAIALCGTGEDRFVILLEYIEHLKADQHWTDPELSELLARVHQLLSRLDQPGA